MCTLETPLAFIESSGRLARPIGISFQGRSQPALNDSFESIEACYVRQKIVHKRTLVMGGRSLGTLALVAIVL